MAETELISRQEAIDALKGLPTWWADEGGYYGGAQPPMVALLDPEDAVSAIENLPPAQPEIIHCRDCKHQIKDFHEDKRRKDGGYYVYGCELADDYSHVCLDDDFCSRAERQEE